MKKVYKYPFEITDEQTIEMPKGAKILTAQVQQGTPTIWALVDPAESQTESVNIRTHGTGHSIPDSECLEYINTIQVYGGQLIFHVFKLTK